MTGMALIRTISSQERRQRIREVRQGPDGFLSLLTDHVDDGAAAHRAGAVTAGAGQLRDRRLPATPRPGE